MGVLSALILAACGGLQKREVPRMKINRTNNKVKRQQL